MSDTLKTMLISLIVSMLGGSGLVGVLFFFLRRYLTRRLDESDARQQYRKEIRRRRMKIDAEITSAHGKMFHWIYKYITKGEKNEDLDHAFEWLKEVESRKKELDREIIVENDCD